MTTVQQLQTLLAGRQYTNPNKSIYEEAPAAPPAVVPSQIRTAVVPISAPFGTPEKAYAGAQYPTTGVATLKMVWNVPMTPANNITSLSFTHPQLPTAIQDSYGDGSYRPYLTNNTGTRIIPLGSNGMFINYSGGNITFTTAAADVTNTLPPRITFYNYVGGSGIATTTNVVTLNNTTMVAACNAVSGIVQLTVQSAIVGSPSATILLSKNNPASVSPVYNITMVTLGADGSAIVFTWPPNAGISVSKTTTQYDGAYSIIVTSS